MQEEEFVEYESLMDIYLYDHEKAYEIGLFEEPEPPAGYADYKMRKDAAAYELHLQMFIDAGADEHARREVGEPKKPATYELYLATIAAEKEAAFLNYEYLHRLYCDARDDQERNSISHVEPEPPEGYAFYKIEKDKKQALKKVLGFAPDDGDAAFGVAFGAFPAE